LRSGLSKLSSGKRPNKSERRLLARAHPAYFAWLYLRGDDGATMTPTPFHLEWYDLVLKQLAGEIRHVCIMAPKSHAKSTVLSKVVPLWLTCTVDPNLRTINGAVNSSLAERFLRANRRELEQNALLIEDFGPFRPEDPEKWTQTELIVRRASSSPSPTWRAVGTGMPVQGGRSDWIIGDDLADLENSMSQLQRDRMEEWFDGDLMGTLEPTGHAIVIGTAKHNDDLYSRIEKKSKQPGSGWVFRRYDAIVDEPAKRTLWPARWSWDALMAKKADVGSMTFNRDYRNVAVNDETSLFPMALLAAAKRPELTFLESYGAGVEENDTVTGAIDLAIVENERDAQATDSDYTVIMVWRRLKSGARRLIWAERRRGLGITPQLQLAEATLRRYGANLKIVIVEANQAQRWFASSLLSETKGDLPIKKHVTGKGVRVDVYEGIPSLTALFEAGMIELPYGDERSRTFVDVFVNELHGLGVERHDDTVLAFWLNEIGIRKLSSTRTFATLATRAG
jgi:hypothetical protein